MKPAILLRHIGLHSTLRRFRCKKDIPQGVQGTPILVSFGLWGQWYVVKGFGGLLCVDMPDMPFHEMRTRDNKVVIGQRDKSAGEGTPYAETWRESMSNSINDRLALH